MTAAILAVTLSGIPWLYQPATVRGQTFSTPLNNASSTLGANYTAASGSMTLATGSGSRFGTPSSGAPIRITVASKATLSNGQIGPNTSRTIFLCTARTGDVLSGLTAVEGTSDQNFKQGDPVAALLTAGMFTDITTAIAALPVDSSVVHKTGTESVSGLKTFAAPADNSQALILTPHSSGQTANVTEVRDSSNNLRFGLGPLGQLVHDTSTVALDTPGTLWTATADSGPKFHWLLNRSANALYNGVAVPDNVVASFGWNIANEFSSENPTYYYVRDAFERGWVWTGGAGGGVDIWQAERHIAAMGSSTSSGDAVRPITIATRLDGSYWTYVGVQAGNFYVHDESSPTGANLFQILGGVSQGGGTSMLLYNGNSGAVGYVLNVASGTTDTWSLGRSNTTINRATIQHPTSGTCSLHVGSGQFMFEFDGTNQTVKAESGTIAIQTQAAAALTLGTSSLARLFIKSDGSIGLGTTDPKSAAHLDLGQLRITDTGAGDVPTHGVNTLGIMMTAAQAAQGIEYEASTAGAGFGFRVRAYDPGTGVVRLYWDQRANSTTFSTILALDNTGNLGLGTVDQFGSGAGVFGLAKATTAPTTNPTNAFAIYVDPADSKLKARGPSGTVTTLALP